MPTQWDRRPGENSKRYAAFSHYISLAPHERSTERVRRDLGYRSKRHLETWSAQDEWVARAQAYDEHQAYVLRMAAETEVRAMAERHAKLALGLMAKVTEALRGTDAGDIKPKDLAQWAKIGAELERAARGILVGDKDAKDDPAHLTSTAEERWRQTYIQPEGTFAPHRKQREAINAVQRFVALVAGVQSGKTVGAALSFWRRILDERATLRAKGETGFYWMIAPNSIVGEVMCEAFEEWAPPGEIVRSRGHASGRTWDLRDGSRVQFRSGEHADKLVARRVHGAWLDEFTILKRDVWVVSVRQRLATTSGWAIFSGTPRGRNWAWEEIWRRTLPEDDKHDDDYAGFTWPSCENPAIAPSEVDAARRQLPPAYFRREWEASWEAFHGQVFDTWSRELFFLKIALEAHEAVGATTYMGVDWGFANPGAVVVGRRLADGTWHVIDELQESGKLPDWWKQRIVDLWKRHRVARIWCDPEDAGAIAALVAEGLPAEKANNDVHDGIRYLASLITQARFLVDKGCPKVAGQLEAYHWKEDRAGNRSEQPVKENDHGVDAARYMAWSTALEDQRSPGERVSYGGTPIRRKQR